MSKYDLEDAETHMTKIWGDSEIHYYTEHEGVYFNYFRDFLYFAGGKVLEIGPGTGKFASMLINFFPITHYTILDLKKNIKDSMKTLENFDFVKFVESKDYKEVFNQDYDLFVANNCLSETPAYYREEIVDNIFPRCKSVFIIDGDAQQGNFNDWLMISVMKNFKSFIRKPSRSGTYAIGGER